METDIRLFVDPDKEEPDCLSTPDISKARRLDPTARSIFDPAGAQRSC